MFVAYAIGCITATIILPIVVINVYGFRWSIAIPLMLMSITLLPWSWLTVIFFVYHSAIRWDTLDKYRRATECEPR